MRDPSRFARAGTTERLPRVEGCYCCALAPREQAGHDAAKVWGWPGLNIAQYTTEACRCQRAGPHLDYAELGFVSQPLDVRTDDLGDSEMPLHDIFRTDAR